MRKILSTGVLLSDSFMEQHSEVYSTGMHLWFVFEAFNHYSFVARVESARPVLLFYNGDRSVWHFDNYETFTPKRPKEWSLVNQWINITEPTPRSMQLPDRFGNDGIFYSLEEALKEANPWPGCPEWIRAGAVWQYRHNYLNSMPPERHTELREFLKKLPNHRDREVHVRRK